MIKLLIDFVPSQECNANIGLSVSLPTSKVKGAWPEVLRPYVLIKENKHAECVLDVGWGWGVLCFVLGNHETHATLRLTESSQEWDLDSWCISFPISLTEHSSCVPMAGTQARPLLLVHMRIYFVPSIEVCFPFFFCLVYLVYFLSFCFKSIPWPTPGCHSRTLHYWMCITVSIISVFHNVW